MMRDDLRKQVALARAAYDDHQDITSLPEPDATTEYIAALETAIADQADTDAQAALEAVKREARNGALREAEAAISKLRMQNQDIVSQWNGAIDQVSDVILALMEDQSDE